MHKLMLFISKSLEKILMFAMAAIVFTVTWQVFSRFILQSPSSYTEELARYLLIWIGILGSAYAYKAKAHLGLDLFVEKLAPAKKIKVRMLIEVLVIVFACSVMIYGGSLLMSMTIELKQTSAALGINMGIIYSAIPLSGILIVMFALDNIVQLRKARLGTQDTVNQNIVKGTL
ncbi:TRAP transporter small permease [Colwellia sp. MB02u-18]|uniref:TRAP transporter small permease n=1 Tax=unclassified Colwellia TaxID=196834 RepID=UPI0015F39201|nr:MULTISPECIES: TRAP transporter small permease [unclassified Colwellia]MBA6222643.1 TRAP transporter small permease [Colwellia sp. MB3u-45]MBA6269169.1 TRAP transporter small permease [Colwellia sp. MB3u-43]MBA6322776.1 TRAP transporter small permease [Colwellia sp. MB02u-19]MBA6323451.1 TRAP transporter small permease [Colwellia sp. MB02u-18]MBA6332919.1 TRAP transporter small permease [Colwellia sp. MB02u-12]